ncbi:MAG: 4-alpha-glucanotransferase [Candidatus Anoxychlamydiales bacterium]|nr:4-alpha-glucanotransferase [Candidatus Anoxychlamydiales bacterium]
MIDKNLKDYINSTPASNHWEKLGIKDHHGITVPLFAIVCEKSSGIGEFLDLFEVIDFIKEIGFDTLQLLPLNETGKDPSPYNALSSLALNPLHISLHALESLDDNYELKEKLKDFKIFNTYQRVHYLKLKKLKMDFLYDYYLYVFKTLKENKEFNHFLQENSWLEEYALYRTILEEQNDKHWDIWPDDLKNLNKKNIPSLIEKYHDKMHFYFFLQYLAFSQLQSVKKYADENNIFILGDVPILISPYSCDVWFNREIFDFTYVAGAPPDSYSLYGQKWGFPLFNWKKLEENNYSWWKRRLKTIESLYHMYRIDHVVGFFRLWSIDPNSDATEGRFIPRDPTSWKKEGTKRLKMMLHSSKLLPIAEDLGLIPKIVYKTLKELGICGTKVIPWERTAFGYIKFNNYEPLSVTTISTHDSDTFEGWWETAVQYATKFAKFKRWQYSYKLSYHQRKELLYDSHHTSSIFHINLLQEYLALYPELSYPDPDDERINIPGTMLPTNWSYKYKVSFDKIKSHQKLKEDLKDLLK